MVVSTLLYLSLSPATSASPLFLPAQMIQALIGVTAINLTFYIIAVAHILESLYTLSLCRRHNTGFNVGVSRRPPFDV